MRTNIWMHHLIVRCFPFDHWTAGYLFYVKREIRLLALSKHSNLALTLGFMLSFCLIQIFRKAALKIVSENVSKIVVDTNNLQEFVGKPIFTHDRLYSSTPPGVVTGLAWTAMGKSCTPLQVWCLSSAEMLSVADAFVQWVSSFLETTSCLLGHILCTSMCRCSHWFLVF